MGTIPDVLMQTVKRYRTRTALIEPVEGQELATVTFQELLQRVQGFAGYLQQQQLSRGDRVMIWSASRTDWLIAYFGALLLGLVVVPLDLNTREDFLQRLIETTEACYLITTQKQYAGLHAVQLPLIDIDALPQAPLDPAALPAIAPDDLAELVFTSGTTGQPKGVMISHANIVSNAQAAVQVVQITEHDRALSILPLSHMFEMTIDMALLFAGASIVYARSLAPDTLFRLLGTQQVTVMVLVPQALQLFLNGLEREVRRQHKERQWHLLLAIAQRLPFALRRYLFAAVHKRFGGHFRLFVSGGAYLAPRLGQTWENMGFRVLPGYGATECSPIVSVTTPHDHNLTTVGPPLPGIEVRIADDHEILVHGPNVAQGYWKNPEATAAAFDHGWYATGDLGYIDNRHRLVLKGRKKNLIVLANGLNVYPEDVENALNNQEGVKEAVVLGLMEQDQGPSVHAVLLMDAPDKAKQAVQSANKLLTPQQQIRGFTLWPEEDFPRTHTLKVKRQEVQTGLERLRTSK